LKVALNTTILTLYTGTGLFGVNIEDISFSLKEDIFNVGTMDRSTNPTYRTV